MLVAIVVETVVVLAVLGILLVMVVANGLLLVGATLELAVETALGATVFIAVIVRFGGAEAGITGIPIVGILVVTQWLLDGAQLIIRTTTLGLSVFVTLVIEYKGAVVDDGIHWFVFVAYWLLLVVGALNLVVETTLWSAVFVAVIVWFGGAKVGIVGIAIGGVLVVTCWLLDGTDMSLDEAARGFSEFVALVVQFKGAIVDDGFDGFAVLAFGSLVGTRELVVEAALGVTIFVAVRIRFHGTVLGTIIDGVVVVAR